MLSRYWMCPCLMHDTNLQNEIVFRSAHVHMHLLLLYIDVMLTKPKGALGTLATTQNKTLHSSEEP